MLERIEHIALAVSDLEAAIDHYTTNWRLTLAYREVIEDQEAEEAMLRVGESYIQLVAPLNPDTIIGRFLEREGEGLHHIAYQVGDLEAAIRYLKRKGVLLINEEPRRGSRDTRVAFVHPKSNRGVLAELVERI